MDELVIQAMAKWPNVPDCYGWLGLDARGDWYLRDDAVQAAGAFPQAKGERLEHAGLLQFIGRNYAADDQGRWFFQNGPQRVFVGLECTPWIWRLQPDGQVLAHTGRPGGAVRRCLLDGQGRAYLDCTLGLGLVHSMDVALLAQLLESRGWPVREVAAPDLPSAYGFVQQPRA